MSTWRIPPSVLDHLDAVPSDRPVVLLLRHSVRGPLPADAPGDEVCLTDDGRALAREFGVRLGNRLASVHASPVLRCIETAQELSAGAKHTGDVRADRLLGAPGVFVLDGVAAWSNWQVLGHEGVMARLCSSSAPLPGMARPNEAARYLLQHLLAETSGLKGIHAFVTHDSVLAAAAAQLLGSPPSEGQWPWFLEGAFFWPESVDAARVEARAGVVVRYGDQRGFLEFPLCPLGEHDVVEFARREVAATLGNDLRVRFFLAGGAFKSLLTGRAPRDLDLWAPSPEDRSALIARLLGRGAHLAAAGPFGDTYELGERAIDVPFKTEPDSLAERLARFDIALSAVGAEHTADGRWSARVHPLALESVRRREVLLLLPLVNWRYALPTLERLRRYGDELGYAVPQSEEEEIWRVFESQEPATREGMLERYRRTGMGRPDVVYELARRLG